MESSKNTYESSPFASALAGATAGAVTRAICQPFDVLKIRFQLQLEPIKISQGSKYYSMLQAVRSVVMEEGVTSMWSGHIPAQLLSISYGIVQFSVYEKLTELCQKANHQFYNSNKHSINFSNGAIAATLGTLVSFPFDTVRTRLIAEQKTRRAYMGFSHAFCTIVRNEGFLALFKGLLPTLGQIAPYAGIQFSVYKFLTENVMNNVFIFQRQTSFGSSKDSSFIANLIAGSLSGLVSKTAIYPFDLIKKRLQIQGFQQHRISFGRQIYCNGSLHCISLTIREEGFLALYKGYLPSLLKALVVSALHFAVYDEIKHYLLKM